MLRPPQLRFLRTVEVASFTVPQKAPPGDDSVKSRRPDAHGGSGQVVVVVKDVVVNVVDVVVGQGFGKHEPGPKSTPPSRAHRDADSTRQPPKPRQHWIAGRVVVVGHGSGSHEPEPTLNPPAESHWLAVPTKQAKGAGGTQHWIASRLVDVVVDVVVVLMVGLVVDVVDVVVTVVGGGLVVVVVVVGHGPTRGRHFKM
jgi:hypothetical protein